MRLSSGHLLICIITILLNVLSTHCYPGPKARHPRPLVLWHGLGDSFNAPGIQNFIEAVKEMHPGIFVHAVYVDEDGEKDRKATYFGNVNEQLYYVSEQIRAIPELEGGFDAVGFSQAGQFLRAYVERYNSPPVHNLITYGSQHMGVADIPLCRPLDVLCQLARRAARGGVYTEWAQTHLVPAQYHRDPDQLSLYLEHNHFLPDINNELDVNKTYISNFESLNKLVLVLFSQDNTVVPKESSWFGSYAPRESDILNHTHPSADERTLIPMRLQPLYVNNTIGLKTLDERGDLILETCDGEHMQISPECWKPLFRKYIGGPVAPNTIGEVASLSGKQRVFGLPAQDAH